MSRASRPEARDPSGAASAVAQASAAATSDDVVFFAHTYELTHGEREQLGARGVRVVGGAVARLVVEGDRLTGVELVEGAVVARSAVFLRPGIAPHPDGLLAALGCALDPAGFVPVDATGWTGVFGVWVAGNAADPRALVITAAGAGSAAAIALNADLVLEDVERARGAARARGCGVVRRPTRRGPTALGTRSHALRVAAGAYEASDRPAREGPGRPPVSSAERRCGQCICIPPAPAPMRTAGIRALEEKGVTA